MRSFILLIVIALQALIGWTVPIKFLDHLTPEKSLAEVSQKKKGNPFSAFKNIDPKLILDGDTGAIFDLASAGVKTIGNILTDKKLMGKMQAVSAAIPYVGQVIQVAAMFADIYAAFEPEKPDPFLQKISDQITALDSKLDQQHKDTMNAFNYLSAQVCESALKPSIGLLQTLAKQMKTRTTKHVSKRDNIKYCGLHQTTCFGAMGIIGTGFPECLDKMIKASLFKGPEKLQVEGNLEGVQPVIEAYIALLVEAQKNIGLLAVYELTDNFIAENKELEEKHFDELQKQHSDLQVIMDDVLEAIHNRLSNLATFKVEDWGQRNFGRAFGKREIGKPSYHSAEIGYAIKGFWRTSWTMLDGIKLVLIGKGQVDFLGWQTEAVFNKALRDNNGQEWTRASHMARCPERYVLRGLKTAARFSDEMWLQDITAGQCITATDQRDNKRSYSTQLDCYSQKLSWNQNEWALCEKPGYYVAGMEKFGGRGPGLETLSGFECCMPLLLPFKTSS